MTLETMFFYIVFVFLLILSIMFFYYLRSYRIKLVLVEKEYENSKDVIKNIVITFKKRQEEQENKMDDILYNFESLFSRIEVLDSIIKDHEKKILGINDDIKTSLLANVKIVQHLFDLNGVDRPSVISRRVLDIKSPGIDERRADVFQENRARVHILDDSVLNDLTDTEKQILTILSKQGEKTAPEIEKIIDKTREHTSRLMKKLYAVGYVNRNTNKIPYVYKINNDLIEIINVNEK